MSLSRDDLYDFSTNSGLASTKTGSVRSTIETDVKTALSAPNADTTEATRLGRFVSLLSDVTCETTSLNAQVANDFNLNAATGVALDHLGAIFGLKRKAATHTSVTVDFYCSAPNITIPKGTIVTTNDGYDFTLDEELNSGSVNNVSSFTSGNEATSGNTLVTTQGVEVYWTVGTAHAVDPGLVYAPAYSINTVKTAFVGFYSVYNTTAGELGHDEETDGQFRMRIKKARDTGSSTCSAILNAVYKAKDSDGNILVSDAVALENGHAYPIVRDGIVIPPHSVYVCADFNDDYYSRVPNAVETSKTLGADYMRKDAAFSDLAKNISSYGNVVYFRSVRRGLKVSISYSPNSSIGNGPTVAGEIRKAIQEYLAEEGIGARITTYSVLSTLNERFGDGLIVRKIKLGYGGESVDGVTLSAGESFTTNCDSTANPKLDCMVTSEDMDW